MINILLLQIMETGFQILPAHRLINILTECELPGPTETSNDLVLNIIIIIGIQPLDRFGQGPELSQATDIALVRCILGKFLGVGCHYFPPC
jgi:hypothetical protein